MTCDNNKTTGGCQDCNCSTDSTDEVIAVETDDVTGITKGKHYVILTVSVWERIVSLVAQERSWTEQDLIDAVANNGWMKKGGIDPDIEAESDSDSASN